MSDHTPGPWTIGGTFMPYSDDPRENVWGPHPGMASGMVVCTEVRPADARLIAAAPDLLEALKNLVKPMDDLGFLDGDESDRVFPQYEFDQARAAIAKAEAHS